ncbi:MAG TPA: hypothetical protein VNH22_07025 [Blastocatellia bacterium]|jgi:hypothetical protein|nr:hypothetical protein [Blastocatellia bacterium]
MGIKLSPRVREFLSPLLLLILLTPVLAPYRVIAAAPGIHARPQGPGAGQSDPEEEAVTFENLLPAESYGLYGEARNIGQQITSGGFRSILETLLPLMGEFPPELTGTILFASAHASEISRSRMMFATLPARRNIPTMLMAIELSSSEAAREFEPDFTKFVASLLAPGPGQAALAKASGAVIGPQSGPSPFFIKSMGRLVVLADASFTVKQLRPEGHRLLSADPNFRDARAHFASEELFVYYDSKQYAQASKQAYEEFMKAEAEAGEGASALNRPYLTAETSAGTPVMTGEVVVDEESPAPPVPDEEKPQKKEEPVKAATSAAKPEPKGEATAPAPAAASPRKGADEEIEGAGQAPPPPPPPPGAPPSGGMRIFDRLIDSIFSGLSSQQAGPYESIAFALTFEADSLAIRALFLSPPGSQVAAIPFLPFIASGPPLPLVASNYLPAETEIFLSGSLDLRRIFDEVYPALSNAGLSNAGPRPDEENVRGRRGKPEVSKTFGARIAAFEKKRGVNLRDGLLPALGNEVALALPTSAFIGGNAPPAAGTLPEQQAAQLGPILVVSVQNKQLLKPHIPAILELLDVLKAGEKGKIEKRGEIEINNYSSASFALVDDFLIAAQDVRDLRRALDARASGQTLGASKEFRDYTRWQPRHLLNQVHVSSSIMKSVLADAKKTADKADERTKEFFARINFPPEAVSYAASMEVLGSQHEIRLPKNMVITLIGYLMAEENRMAMPRNEVSARATLTHINIIQETYHSEHGGYATFEELEKHYSLSKSDLDKGGYRFDLIVAGGRYQITATPKEYEKTGKLSFYSDETGIIRAGDHGGSAASAQDKPAYGDGNEGGSKRQ